MYGSEESLRISGKFQSTAANVTNDIRSEVPLIAVMFRLRTSLSECPGEPKNRATEFDKRHNSPNK